MADLPEMCHLHGDRLTRIETTLESLRDDYLESIKEQTMRTNGRVSVLEATAARSGVWIAVLWIVLGAVTAFMGGTMAQHLLTDRVTDLQQLQQSK